MGPLGPAGLGAGFGRGAPSVLAGLAGAGRLGRGLVLPPRGGGGGGGIVPRGTVTVGLAAVVGGGLGGAGLFTGAVAWA